MKFVVYIVFVLGTFMSFIDVSNQSCKKTKDSQPFHFYYGMLSPDRREDTQLAEEIMNNLNPNDTDVKNCFYAKIVYLKVKEHLNINTLGWTNIESAIKTQLDIEGNEREETLSVIIGPFYTNVAMMSQRLNIPYIVTDYKGYDWIDINRVRDPISWKTMVEMKPAPQEVNMALVDLMKAEKWESAVVVKPDDPRSDQECNDLLYQMIDRRISPISYSLGKDKKEEQSSELLRTCVMLGINVVLVCSPRDAEQNLIKTILETAKKLGLLNEEKRVFILLDTDFYLQTLKELNIYRDKYYTAKSKILAYRYREVVEKSTSPTEVIAKDVCRVINEARKRYISLDGLQSKIDRTEFLKCLLEVSFDDGESGRVMFNSTGQRINYHLHLFQHGGGDELYQKFGEWSASKSTPEERLILTDINKTDIQQGTGLFQETVRVAVVLEKPFVMRKTESGHEGYEGFSIDVLKELARMCNFQYEIYEAASYGKRNGSSWNGMVGEVMNGRATLGLGAISITSDREKDVDFSLGVMTTGINLLISKPNELESIFQFMSPFSLELWMAIVGASVIVSVIYVILDFKYEDRKFTIKETIWFSIGTLLMRGTDFSPRPSSQRILTTGFTFFVLITISSYTANMTAFLTIKNLEPSIGKVLDILDRGDYSCGTVKNSATSSYFEESREFSGIWKRMIETNGLVPNSDIGRQKVSEGNYAFIFDYRINSYSEKTGDCKSKMVGTPFRFQEHGIVMRQGAVFKNVLNLNLLKMKESNKLHDFERKWWENKRTCDFRQKDPTVEFTLSQMVGVFIVGGAGLVFSVAFFLLKKFYIERQAAKAKKVENKEKEAKQLMVFEKYSAGEDGSKPVSV